MSKKLYIGNLPYSITEEGLKETFSEVGPVESVKIIIDAFSGSSKGFGFIEMEGHEARAAITGLNGKNFNGKQLRVNFEEPRDNFKKKGGRRR